MKLSENQREKIEHAMDLLHDVKVELEEANKHKRIQQRLDKAEGILYNLCQE